MTRKTSTELTQRIQLDMRNAMKDRNTTKANTLKDLLARFSNEEAVSIQSTNLRDITATEITGAHSGVGSTEVARKTLSLADHERIIADEITEIQHVIGQLDQPSSYRAELEQKISLLRNYLP